MSNLKLIFFFTFFKCSIQDLIVTTSRGPVVGYHVDYGSNKSEVYYGEADVFLGVPYAKPPIGELRFKESERLDRFSEQDTRWNATYQRPACPQPVADDSWISEDCLYMNIITPKANSSYKYPVMVYIYGGALYEGSINTNVDNYYDVKGAVRNMVSRGVLVVAFQYRVGILGFFTTKTNDFPANLGLLDQVLALKFVHEEIANFGGDPYRVTIFGNSAGGCSVSALTYSPMVTSLFHQAIMESGTIQTCFDNVMGTKTALEHSFEKAQSLCNYTQELWDTKNFTVLKNCLMNMDYHKFIVGNDGWTISVDGKFLTDDPEILWRSRPNIPIIMGTNRDEFAGWLLALGNLSNFGPDLLPKSLMAFFPKLIQENPKITSILQKIYAQFLVDGDHLAWFKALTQAFTGAMFTGFTGHEVDYYVQNNNSNVYLYEFTWPTSLYRPFDISGWRPVIHAIERYYIWMPEGLWIPAIKNGLVNKTEFDIAERMGEFWTSFAKFGTPSLASSWIPVSSSYTKNFYEIGKGMGMRSNYRMVDGITWNQVVPGLAGSWPMK